MTVLHQLTEFPVFKAAMLATKVRKYSEKTELQAVAPFQPAAVGADGTMTIDNVLDRTVDLLQQVHPDEGWHKVVEEQDCICFARTDAVTYLRYTITVDL